jgi:hypothetical protein
VDNQRIWLIDRDALAQELERTRAEA